MTTDYIALYNALSAGEIPTRHIKVGFAWQETPASEYGGWDVTLFAVPLDMPESEQRAFLVWLLAGMDFARTYIHYWYFDIESPVAAVERWERQLNFSGGMNHDSG